MKRREEITGRSDVTGFLSNTLGQGAHLGASAATTYIRSVPPLPMQSQPRISPLHQKQTAGACITTTIGGQSASINQDLHTLSHLGHSTSTIKVDMHTGVHHSIPVYTASLPVANTQQSNLSIEGGRNVNPNQVTPLISQGGHSSPLPVLQHGTAPVHPSSQLRQRTLIGAPSGGSCSVLPTSIAGASIPTTMSACAVGSGQVTGQFQRLKVEDALSYLDQVKLRFGRQPQVYNDFLDIMKEFKSQSIDTPGVIARVSQLFSGHPELIVGFNTFLPPGYKIEVSVSVPGQQMTVVHTPQGIHHHVTPTPHTAIQGGGQLPPNNHLLTAPISSVKVPQLHPGLQRSTNLSIASHPVVTPVPTPSPGMTVIGSLLSSSTSHTSTNIAIPPIVNSLVPPTQHPSLHTLGSVVLSSVEVAPVITQPSTQVSLANTVVSTSTPATTTNIQHATNPHSHHMHQQPAQPVEFNHAINYVNKIKHRFQGQPDTYKQFLEILHTYQKEQKYIKEGGSLPTRTLTEGEVYEKVAKLFENQEDLLQEFGQFLPDATNNTAAQAAVSDFMDQCRSNQITAKASIDPVAKKFPKQSPTPGATNIVTNSLSITSPTASQPPISSIHNSSTYGSPPMPPSQSLKRAHSRGGGNCSPNELVTTTHSTGILHSQPPVKKPKLSFLKDMSAAEAGKYATLSEYAFFDKVRKALRHEETYYNFLRCVTLYNEEIISRSELVQLIHPFLTKFPDLLKYFKDFVGCHEGISSTIESIPQNIAKQERIGGDLALEIDYTTCKRLGASYCALPKSHLEMKCGGRNALCKDVLNDTWVSFPSWSEDSTFVTSRKTQYEEYIYRCEDERFELDVVLETNLSTMRVLEGVEKKLQRMSAEDAARYRLDSNLGGNSPSIHQRAIRRIYGDKANDIIDGLKKNPIVAVPLVLRRLKAKDEEWREAQKGFNKVWRDQNERYYIKSLDHQGITFKQHDIKLLRSKTLLNEIETLYDERHEHMEEGDESVVGPHMILACKDAALMVDAANLIIHHVKRQTTIHKEDKGKIKQLVRQFTPDLFFQPRMDLSDDEKDMDDDNEDWLSSDNKHFEYGTEVKNNIKEKCFEKEKEAEAKETNPPTNNNKRKTRSNKNSDSEKENDGKKDLEDNSKEKEYINAVPGSINGLKVKEEVLVNGEASEAEKIEIKREFEEGQVKVEIKKEPLSPDDNKSFSTACSSLADDEYRLFFGNNNWYLFLRLHQILCLRLSTMYEYSIKIAAEEAKEKKERKESTAIALRLKPKSEIQVEDYYPVLLDMIKNVLDGNLECTAYEDSLRDMFGIHAYTAFTLDKVVNGAVRQLQHIVCDDLPSQCTSLYLSDAKGGGCGGPIISAHRRFPFELGHQRKAEKLMENENCFKIFTYKRDLRMSFELIETDVEEVDENGISISSIPTTSSNSFVSTTSAASSCITTTTTTTTTSCTPSSDIVCSTSNLVTSTSCTSSTIVEEESLLTPSLCMHPLMPPAIVELEGWSDYVERYVSSMASQVTPAMQALLSKKPVFLPRNLRSWKKVSKWMDKNRKEEDAGVGVGGGSGVSPGSMEAVDNTQCKMNLSNLKMVFVVNSDSYMYKKDALKRAKKSHKHVSGQMLKGISKWHSSWSAINVSEEQSNAAESWFMGECSGLQSNKTLRRKLDHIDKAPFKLFSKYTCEILELAKSCNKDVSLKSTTKELIKVTKDTTSTSSSIIGGGGGGVGS